MRRTRMASNKEIMLSRPDFEEIHMEKFPISFFNEIASECNSTGRKYFESDILVLQS